MRNSSTSLRASKILKLGTYATVRNKEKTRNNTEKRMQKSTHTRGGKNIKYTIYEKGEEKLK